jgi:hypothetical protein
MLNGLDEKAIKRLSGQAWEAILPQVETINAALIGVSPTASGKLARVYIKYTTVETGDQPFAVLWVKASAEVVLGLSLPEDFDTSTIPSPEKPICYRGITKYLVFRVGVEDVPADFATWAYAAYQNTLQLLPTS